MKRAKKIEKKNPRVVICVRLSDETIERLNAISQDRNGLSKSRRIEAAILEYMEKRK